MVRALGTSVAAATLMVSSTVSAGILFGGDNSIDLMQVGHRYINTADPGEIEFTDLAQIFSPPVGSSLLLGGSIPGVEAFYSDLTFTSLVGPTATFEFESDIDIETIPPEFEISFAGSRLVFNTVVPVLLTLTGTVTSDGSASGFFYLYGTAVPVFLFDSVNYSVEIGPGTTAIAWGVLGRDTSPTNDAVFAGSLSLTLVPAPGAVALLAAAGLIAGRRRRD